MAAVTLPVSFSALQGAEADVALQLHNNIKRTLPAALNSKAATISAFRECTTNGRMAFMKVHGATIVGGNTQKRRLEKCYGPGTDIATDMTSGSITLCVPWPQQPHCASTLSLGERLFRNVLYMVLVAALIYVVVEADSFSTFELLRTALGLPRLYSETTTTTPLSNQTGTAPPSSAHSGRTPM